MVVKEAQYFVNHKIIDPQAGIVELKKGPRARKSEIKDLENQILFHKKKYYDGEPVISDEAYDVLEDRLKKLDPENPVLHIVGSPERGKIMHDVPMLSCQKATDIDEVVKWSKGFDLFVGYKIDGFSLSLIYENGKFIQAATRGNGITGDDSTIVAMKIRSIPKSIPATSRVNIRGELFMKISEFNRINNSEGGMYISPRNLAVGTIKQKDLSLLETRSLEFNTFELIGYDETLSFEENNKLMQSWGFKTADFELLKAPTKLNISSLYEKIETKRNTLDFEIDGLIFKYNDTAERIKAGSTAHHPKWMMALKFASQGKISEIRGITWQVGRMGNLTPVAELEPVEVAGATISRATLHNADFLEELDVAEKDMIIVIRSGDVIPKITEVIKKGPNHAEFPTNCPSCDSKLIRDRVNLLCTQNDCREKVIQQIRYFVRTIDIVGLGPKNIAKLYDKGLVQHYSDLFNPKLTKGVLTSLLGKNGSKIYDSIQSFRELPFNTFLASLGIETLGKQMAKVLSRHFSSYDELKNVPISRLVTIEGISDTTAKYIYDGVRDPSKGDRVLSNGVKIIYGKRKKKSRTKKSGGLGDFLDIEDQPDVKEVLSVEDANTKTVYVTGKIEGKTKKEIQNFLKKYNYEWASSVTKNLDILVTGDKPGVAKLKKARQYGIQIKTWNDFIQEFS